MSAFPQQTNELVRLLAEDQKEKKAFGRLYFAMNNEADLESQRTKLKKQSNLRSQRMLQILDEINVPSIRNIGTEGASAISVLAVHDDIHTLQKVLKAFTDLYQKDPGNTYRQAIPSMTDLLRIHERKPQQFGVHWMFDANKQPFLYPVYDLDHVNERRAEYDIGPLRWPRSLAIPDEQQPWLQLPISEANMREPSEEEYRQFFL